MTESTRPTRPAAAAVIAVVVLVIAVHGIDVTHAFTSWDDAQLVTGNELLNPVTPQKLGRMWSAPVIGLYTPLAYTLWAGATLFARTAATDAGLTLSPTAFHALNLLLHAGCSVLVLAILHRLTGGRVMASLIGAAVFAVHPLQVEPVAWVSGMNNLLAGLFSLAAVLTYLKALPPSRRGEGGRNWYFIAVLLFLMACLSKPTAVVTPLILLVIDGVLLRRPLRSIAISLLPFVVIAGVFAVVARNVQTSADVYQPAVHHRLLIAADAVGFYLQTVAVPWPLHIDYGRTPQKVIAAGVSLWPTVALAVAVIAATVFRRRRWVLAGLAVFVLAMGLVIGLVPFDFQAYSTVADRYAYLSMLGVAMLVAFGLSRSGRAACGVAVVVVLVLASLSFAQSLHWKNDQTLAAHQLKHNPDSLGGHALLAGVARSRGDVATTERHYRAYLAIRPQDTAVNHELANLLADTQRPAEALPHFQVAYDNGYRSASMFNNWGRALWQTGQVPRAADLFRESVVRDPDRFNARLNLGMILANLNRLDESAQHLQRAVELDPTSKLARDSLARVNAMRGR